MLLRLLRELHAMMAHDAPYLLGMAACRAYAWPRHHTSPLCHAAGGAAYVLSPAAVVALRQVVRANADAPPLAAHATTAKLEAGGTAEPPLAQIAAAASAALPPSQRLASLLALVDNVSYGGEDVTVALALKEATGASILNCGSFYQHSPAKYARMRAKGERWARWPLSRTPISFHKFKHPDELRAFFVCALYRSDGRLRPFPRSLFPVVDGLANANLSVAEPAYRCADPWHGT
eukprot:scaffold9401_cov31-Tisochrysis_lutea.AAC.1